MFINQLITGGPTLYQLKQSARPRGHFNLLLAFCGGGDRASVRPPSISSQQNGDEWWKHRTLSTWWRTTHESWLWLSSPQFFEWINPTYPIYNWGELTHNHDSWVVRHQVDTACIENVAAAESPWFPCFPACGAPVPHFRNRDRLVGEHNAS